MSLRDTSTVSIPIILGSSNCQFDGQNKFTLTLPFTGHRSGQDEVALKSFNVYYSWNNISAAKGNNTFSYIWPIDDVEYPVVIPDGSWGYAEIRDYLQQLMISRFHYLTDDQDNVIYFMDLQLNDVLYTLSLTYSPIPDTLPAGWKNPGAIDLAAGGGRVPQLVIPGGGAPGGPGSTSASAVLGFTPGTYPPAPMTVKYQMNSNAVPQITEHVSYMLISNLVDSSFLSLTSNVLSSFTLPPVKPGQLVSLSPTNLDWVSVQQNQTFQTITVSLVD